MNLEYLKQTELIGSIVSSTPLPIRLLFFVLFFFMVKNVDHRVKSNSMCTTIQVRLCASMCVCVRACVCARACVCVRVCAMCIEVHIYLCSVGMYHCVYL